MKKSVNWRYAVIIALAIVAFIGIFSEPNEETSNWFAMFVISKSVGFGSAWLAYKANKYWSESNKIVSIL